MLCEVCPYCPCVFTHRLFQLRSDLEASRQEADSLQSSISELRETARSTKDTLKSINESIDDCRYEKDKTERDISEAQFKLLLDARPTIVDERSGRTTPQPEKSKEKSMPAKPDRPKPVEQDDLKDYHAIDGSPVPGAGRRTPHTKPPSASQFNRRKTGATTTQVRCHSHDRVSSGDQSQCLDT